MPRLRPDFLVTWSVVRDMAYCEYMAHLNMVNGKYSYRGHRGRARDVVWSVLKEAGKRFIAEPVVYTMEGVSFYLRPDAVVIGGDNIASMIIKSYIRGNTRIHDSELIPLYITGYMLGRLGMDVDECKLVIIASKSSQELSDTLKGIVMNNTWIHEGSNVKYRLYLEETAEPLVRRVVDVVKGTRSPRPSSNPSKCRRCIYRDTCTYKLL